MPEFRTTKTYDKYKKFIAEGHMKNVCQLCARKTLKEFKYWKILKNDFPWDLVAKVHDMLVPKRHVVEEKLTNPEKKEFDKIKKSYVEKHYGTIAESTRKKKSIPSHFHIHLLVARD